jgi:hypothetical protein
LRGEYGRLEELSAAQSDEPRPSLLRGSFQPARRSNSESTSQGIEDGGITHDYSIHDLIDFVVGGVV